LIAIKKKTNLFKRVLAGLIIYSIGTFFYQNSRGLCYFFTGISILLILSGLRGASFYMPFRNKMKTVFLVFIFWNIITIIRGIFSDYDLHELNPINTYGFMAYLMPLIVLIGIKNMDLKDMVKFSAINAILGIISVIIYFRNIFGTSVILLSPEEYQEYISLLGPTIVLLYNATFVFIIFFVLPKKDKYLAFVTVGLLLIILVVAGRRGALLMTGLTIIFAIYTYIFKYKSKGSSKMLKWFFTAAVLGSIFLLVYINFDSLFSFLIQRGVEDTRATVQDEFFKNFDGNYLDWLFGRGISGTYFTTVFESNMERGIMESGYLHLILKGGILSLALFVIILINSFIKGFFRSNNVIVKAMALYILIHVVYLYPFGIPMFTLEYLFLWCSVAYCQSAYWRSLSDFQILGKKGLL